MWVPLALALVVAGAATDAEDPAPAAAPAAITRASVHPWGVGLEVGFDLPFERVQLPMPSARLEFTRRLTLPMSTFAIIGVRTGYSYGAGEGRAADPVLGVDEHAFLMAHRVPVRALGRLGLHADGADAGIQLSGGLDVVAVQAQSFGRTTAFTAMTAAASLGGFVTVPLGRDFALGLVGEWDTARIDLSTLTPGLTGDLSGIRLALLVSFLFG